ncbi:MAG: DUF3795 domain-containing protein [Lachnospiraceae bacterium]|nr:DUF3795 domain-containing protein [Lachnospiraceae bacterium]
MKDFIRSNQYFSLCGLNCRLCPMNLAGHCSGCGVDNQSCKIAKCSIEHGNIEYCFQCNSFPCPKYEHISDFDSFITHKNQMSDIEKFKRIGLSAYNAEQIEKRRILEFFLSNFNDGRKKTRFSVAVNLLDIDALQSVIRELESDRDFNDMGLKEKSALVAKYLQDIAEKKNITLKLRKK